MLDQKLHIGQRVNKVGGDYKFCGEIVCVFSKRSGRIRVVVENDDGLLFIFNEKQLQKEADA